MIVEVTDDGERTNQVAERIAGVDAAEDEPEDDVGLAKEFVDEYSRSELGDICKELREDADEFNLQENQSKSSRAEFIAAADEDDRADAIAAADVGGDD